MKSEKFKAENSDELVWLRLNRLKSARLCENLIKDKLEKKANPRITDDIIKSKAIGLSSAIESAIGYWQAQPTSCERSAIPNLANRPTQLIRLPSQTRN